MEEWNSGIDDDGVPFRTKIYAVFPGFEPSFKQGQSGLHLLFLLDPEIGREHYLRAFDLAMGGVSPWHVNELQLSNRDSENAFQELREFHSRECPGTQNDGFQWNYIVLAPHIDSDKGLLGAQRAHVLELFQHGEVAGLELGDNKLPEDTLADKPWLRNSMAEYRQSFYHGSDAYKVAEIGNRHTWVKLATPRIEALRQAFIASDSRVRIGYRRDTDGDLEEIPDPPDVTMNNRPWLKSVTVTGRASFFGANGAGGSGSRFDLSPDLTCIIGGSMTGKSTFLDGLRVYVQAPLPQDISLRSQVEARGRDMFLGGAPEVNLDCPGQDPTAPRHERWPAEFYAQSELRRLAEAPEAVEDILARLVASETADINVRERRMSTVDRELTRAAKSLEQLDEDLADAEQACQRSRNAAQELATFSDAGVEDLHRASRDVQRWQESAKSIGELINSLVKLLASADEVNLEEIDGHLASVLQPAGTGEQVDELRTHWERAQGFLRSSRAEYEAASAIIQSIVEVLESHERDVRVRVDRELAARGLGAAGIQQFQALNSQASLLASYEANLDQVRRKHESEESSFANSLSDRQRLTDEQRRAFDRVIETIRAQFDGRISASRIDDGNVERLDSFLRTFAERGITRWWNDLKDNERPSPQVLLDKLKANRLQDVSMSPVVQDTFRESLSRSKQRELAAIRCRDRYRLELKMDDGGYRQLDDLSGGQRVSLLLSLLLETYDDRPLVIDQPEDELDNRFLFDSVLPALKRLKGRRQIIMATHNANIVVNGDADLVIQLEADANQGHVAHVGAIEDPGVRDAIVRTVDGGDEAFRLRRLKYGF